LRHAAVDAQRAQRMAGVLVRCFDQIDDLQRDAVEGRTCQLGGGRVPRESQDDAPHLGRPVRRA
jgi:hypothetical protein